MNAGLVPLKRLADLNPETLREDTDPAHQFRYIDIGTTGRGRLISEPVSVTFGSAPSRARRILRPGDTILSTVRTYLRATWTVREQHRNLVASTGFVCLRPTSGIDARYLGWLAESDAVVEEVVARSVGVSYPGVSPSDVGRIKVPCPPLPDQRAVADYLDCETARIDALVQAKLKMLGLLGERIEASAAEMFDRASRMASRVPLWSLMQPAEVTGAPAMEVLSIYRDYGVVPKASRTDNYNKTPDDLSRYQVVDIGDVVVNKMKAWQGTVAVARFSGIVSPDYLVCKVSRKGDESFLHHILRTPQMRAEYKYRSEGVRPSQWRLQWDQMRLIRLPWPDLHEQADLVTSYAANLDNMATIRAKITRQLELLRERRTALVTTALARGARSEGELQDAA